VPLPSSLRPPAHTANGTKATCAPVQHQRQCQHHVSHCGRVGGQVVADGVYGVERCSVYFRSPSGDFMAHYVTQVAPTELKYFALMQTLVRTTCERERERKKREVKIQAMIDAQGLKLRLELLHTGDFEWRRCCQKLHRWGSTRWPCSSAALSVAPRSHTTNTACTPSASKPSSR
jgi:hypothetical protein